MRKLFLIVATLLAFANISEAGRRGRGNTFIFNSPPPPVAVAVPAPTQFRFVPAPGTTVIKSGLFGRTTVRTPNGTIRFR